MGVTVRDSTVFVPSQGTRHPLPTYPWRDAHSERTPLPPYLQVGDGTPYPTESTLEDINNNNKLFSTNYTHGRHY